MADLKRMHLFKTGEHPGTGAKGITFSEADLDAMVQSFSDLQLAGRVPLKAGHSDTQPLTDGQPALGWIKRLWREGKNLFADATDVPTLLYNAIKAARYKFVSIELLKNAVHAGKSFPWVLDAVALLGADVPAVSGLEDLQKLTLSRDSFKFAEALAFRRAFAVTKKTASAAADPDDDTELEQLRAENAALKAAASGAEVKFAQASKTEKVQAARAAVVELLEGATRAQKILPAQRLSFGKALNIDSDEAVLAVDLKAVEGMIGFSGIEARKIMMSRSGSNRDPRGGATLEGSDELAITPAAHAEAVRKFARENGFGCDTFAAWPRYMERHPEQGRAVTAFCFEPAP
jgi:hypothetical protein